ncbi:MAG: tetratricopeptide repeat protein, partial [Chthoniobacterales bacterium]
RTLGNLLVPGFLEMLNEIARELEQPNIAKAPEDERIRLLLDALGPAKALVILDNLESIPKSDRDQLFTFVKRLPQGCKAILTSRRRIGSGSELVQLDILGQDAALATLADLAKHNKLLAKTNEAERIVLWKQTGGNPLLLRWVAGQLGRGSCRTFTDAIEFLRTCPEGNDPLDFIFGDLSNEFTPDEERVLVALTYFALPTKVEHVAAVAGLDGKSVETALDTLANRSLVVPDQEEKQYALVPMVAEFLRKHRPEVVRKIGTQLQERAYELVIKNGYKMHERFPALDASWPIVASALPLFLEGPNPRLQVVCEALQLFLNFTGRWDEWLSLSQQAERKAIAVNDYGHAGWCAQNAGCVHHLRKQGAAVIACADRATTHWQAAKAGAWEFSVAIRLRGMGHQINGDYDAAITAYSQSLEARRTLWKESAEIAAVLSDLADVEKLSGDFVSAERDYLQALRVARAVNDLEGEAIFTSNLACVAVDQMDWPKAERLAREGLAFSEKIRRQELIGGNCCLLATTLIQQGKVADAVPPARRAVEVFTRLGSHRLDGARAVLADAIQGFDE